MTRLHDVLASKSILARASAAMLSIAAFLAAIMAIVAPINQRPDLWRGPPDEYGHRAVAGYYIDHWLPPKVGDPATLDTYSKDYGFSYINDPDPVYPMAGKFAALVSPVLANADLAFRLFNASLLAILAVLCFLRPGAALVFAPLALSPQVWYVFSYFNNDALPVFLSMLLAWQVVDPASAFNRFLDEPRLRKGWWGALAFALLIALLALSKKNFLAVIAFMPALVALQRLGWRSSLLLAATASFAAAWYQGWFQMGGAAVAVIAVVSGGAILAAMLAAPATRPERLRVLARLGLLCALVVTLAAPRYVWDSVIHGSLEEKRAAQGALQEKFAKPDYKPATIYKEREKSYYGIELRARGTPLSELFSPQWAWHSHTFFTGTASYGWIQFFSPPAFYYAILAGYLAITAVYGFAVVRTGNAEGFAALALVCCFSALTIGISLFHSWNNDFQAQGRYLFPILSMLGIGLFLVRGKLPRAAFLAALGYCFVLGLYSYIFTGLRYVPGSF